MIIDWLDFSFIYLYDEVNFNGFDSYNFNVGDLQVEFLENRFNDIQMDFYFGIVEVDFGFVIFKLIIFYVEDECLFYECVDLGVEFVINFFSGGVVIIFVFVRGFFIDFKQEVFMQEIWLVLDYDGFLDWVVGGFY